MYLNPPLLFCSFYEATNRSENFVKPYISMHLLQCSCLPKCNCKATPYSRKSSMNIRKEKPDVFKVIILLLKLVFLKIIAFDQQRLKYNMSVSMQFVDRSHGNSLLMVFSSNHPEFPIFCSGRSYRRH